MLSLKLVRGAENAQGVRPLTHIPPDHARFVIGRDPACDWAIPDKHLAISARHCEVVRIEGRHVLRDLSTNGTFVNGARERLPSDHLLRHGDRIGIGSYLIEVAVVPDAAVSPGAAPAAAASPGPRRGGDPAAMVGANWERAAAQVARPGGVAEADVKTGFTRITKPPPKESADAPLPASLQGAPVLREPAAEAAPAREPVRRAPPGTTDVLQRLAGGLGVPVDALGTTDPAIAAERVARLLRVALLSLHRQLGVQNRQLLELGSRAPAALARTEVGRLRTANGPDEALAALLGAGDDAEAVLLRANRELGQHADRLLAAFYAANQRIAEQLAPATLERAAGDATDAARLWKIYGSVWIALGIGAGKPWETAFGEAAATYVTAAYDDPQLGERPDKAAAGKVNAS